MTIVSWPVDVPVQYSSSQLAEDFSAILPKLPLVTRGLHRPAGGFSHARDGQGCTYGQIEVLTATSSTAKTGGAVQCKNEQNIQNMQINKTNMNYLCKYAIGFIPGTRVRRKAPETAQGASVYQAHHPTMEFSPRPMGILHRNSFVRIA